MQHEMTALRFERYGPPSVLSLAIQDVPVPGPGEVLIEVKATAINPSDVRNVEGVFHSALPRIPGRDYAGIVVACHADISSACHADIGSACHADIGSACHADIGSARHADIGSARHADATSTANASVGQEVWGSGPGFGVIRDGAHAQYIVTRAEWLSEKPKCLSMEQAASVGVPFITAWSALVTEGKIQAGETVLIIGAAGAVGRAATQIAHSRGAKVIPAIRSSTGVPAGTIDTATPDIPRAVRELTGGKGVDLVLDGVGGALFEPALLSLREGGRHIAIVSRGMRRVSFDLVDFYHNKTHLIGVDSLKLTGLEIASVMNQLRPGFESGALRPFALKTWPLSSAVEAYEAADRDGAAMKHVLLPS
jgi:NADPH:quinone reductase-like Zn-dependent oxidoreductase